MAYASCDRGWRRVSANVSGLPNPPAFGAFEAEESENFEIGFKWNLLGGRGLLNVAAYYQVYTDFQYQTQSVEFRDPDSSITLASAAVNVDEAESYGIDSDLTVLLSQNWQLSAALSYNKAKLSDARDVPCTSGEPVLAAVFDFNTCDLTGERAGEQPEWSGNFSSEYSRSLEVLESEWFLRGLFNAEREYFSASEMRDLDSYASVDLFLGLRDIQGSWDLNVWVKNAFDKSAELKTERRNPVPDIENGGSMDTDLVWVRRQ